MNITRHARTRWSERFPAETPDQLVCRFGRAKIPGKAQRRRIRSEWLRLGKTGPGKTFLGAYLLVHGDAWFVCAPGLVVLTVYRG